MRIELERLQKDPDVTIGSLRVDGEWAAWTCEDTVRPPGVKVPGETAIPPGTYKVIVTESVRFKRPLPLLVDVPDFTGVRIHPGNTAADTHGCILVGLDRHGSSIGRSRLAFDTLFTQIRGALARGEAVTVEIW